MPLHEGDPLQLTMKLNMMDGCYSRRVAATLPRFCLVFTPPRSYDDTCIHSLLSNEHHAYAEQGIWIPTPTLVMHAL